MFFIKQVAWKSLKEYVEKNDSITVGADKYPFKGVVLLPSPDEKEPGVYFLNPVYGNSDDGEGDIIIQRNFDPTCPYPPGYPPAAKVK